MMVGAFGEPAWAASTLEGGLPRLIVVHQSERKYVTDADVKRLERNGFVVLFVEYVSKVREIAADAERDE